MFPNIRQTKHRFEFKINPQKAEKPIEMFKNELGKHYEVSYG